MDSSDATDRIRTLNQWNKERGQSGPSIYWSEPPTNYTSIQVPRGCPENSANLNGRKDLSHPRVPRHPLPLVALLPRSISRSGIPWPRTVVGWGTVGWGTIVGRTAVGGRRPLVRGRSGVGRRRWWHHTRYRAHCSDHSTQCGKWKKERKRSRTPWTWLGLDVRRGAEHQNRKGNTYQTHHPYSLHDRTLR
jgi:hypothetical protein